MIAPNNEYKDLPMYSINTSTLTERNTFAKDILCTLIGNTAIHIDDRCANVKLAIQYADELLEQLKDE